MHRQGNQFCSIADIREINEFPVVFFLLLNTPGFLHTGEPVLTTMPTRVRGRDVGVIVLVMLFSVSVLCFLLEVAR